MTFKQSFILSNQIKALVCVTSASLPLSLMAQEEILPTLVVTANKVEQTLEETNASVKVASGEDLESKGVTKVSELEKVFSELVIRTRGNSAYSSITLRGVSSPDFYSPNVLVYVDGVKQDMSFVDAPLNNVERVELLKGPQGSLYGGNAYAGVINIVTKASHTPSLSVSTTQADLFRKYSASASTGKSEAGLYTAFSGSWRDDDGQIEDISTGQKDIDGGHQKSASIKLGYAPEQSPFSIELSASQDDLNSNEETYVRSDRVSEQQYESATQGAIGDLDRHIDLFSIKAGYKKSGYKVTSITALQQREMDRSISGLMFPEDQDTFSQEARINFDTESTKNVTGIFYEDESFTRKDPGYPGYYGPSVNKVDKKTLAIFGQSQYRVNDVFDITGGIRYEHSKLDINYVRTGLNAFSFNNDDSYDNVSPSLSFAWQKNNQSRFYTTISRGYKSGGFNHTVSSSTDSTSYNSERSTNYELGWRGSLPEQNLSISTAVYLIDTSNKQQYVGPIGQQVLTNLGDAQSYGFEFDANWLASEQLSVNASLNLNKSELKNSANSISDYTGNTLPYSPETQVRLSASYLIPQNWFDGDLSYSLSSSYYSKTYFNEANTLSQSAYTLYDTSIEMLLDDVTVSFFVNNLTDEAWRSYSYEQSGSTYSSLGERRTIGVSASLTL